MKKIIFITLLLLLSNTYSQTFSFLPKGLGIEFGLGYNQLKFQKINLAPNENSDPLIRNEFKLSPTVRISWEKNIIQNFFLTPFISYSNLGGKSDVNNNGYEDEYIFKTINLGVLSTYNFDNFSLSLGGRYNRFIKVFGRFYGTLQTTANQSRTWLEEDMNTLFQEWSIDMGARVSYSIYNFIFSLEGWFNITELIHTNFENQTDVNTKNMQFLIGYRL